MHVYIHIMLSDPVHKTSLRDCHFMGEKPPIIKLLEHCFLSTSFAV